MKIKSIIALASLLSLAIISMAFVQKPTLIKTTELAEKKESFLAFLSQFKKVELPYSIGLDDLDGYQNYRDNKTKPAAKSAKKTVIKATQFIPESMAGRFSRMGPPELAPVVRFYPNDKMVAVVYSSKQRFGGELNIAYQLVLYDLKGNILQKQKEKSHFSEAFNLAYSSIEKTMTCSIDAAGNISQTEYENVWKKAVHQHGFNDNKLIDFKPEKTTYLALDSKGNLKETKYAAMASKDRP